MASSPGGNAKFHRKGRLAYFAITALSQWFDKKAEELHVKADSMRKKEAKDKMEDVLRGVKEIAKRIDAKATAPLHMSGGTSRPVYHEQETMQRARMRWMAL